MKKRLLALILCLVLVNSLLPVTAAAAEDLSLESFYVTSSGFQENDGYYSLPIESWGINSSSELRGLVERISFQNLYQNVELTEFVTVGPFDGNTYYLKCQLVFDISTVVLDVSLNETNYFLKIPGYSSAFVRSDLYKSGRNHCIDIIFQVTKNHNWGFIVSENNDTLTAQCQNEGCNTPPLSVTLKADSVTLPTSPFNARLEGKKELKDATGAEIGEIVYKCNKEIVTDQSNPKAGQYQAWVMIKNLPGPVYQDGVAALAEDSNTKGTAELFVHYTAADPAVTAQTGDNRPIEIMLVSALVFSALAAAAFVLDGKRKYRQ